jgi:hypothetical protein
MSKHETTNSRPQKGRAILYLRDSGGRHETTPSEYVLWAASYAAREGLKFDGTAATVEEMIRQRASHCGDVFLDWGIPGNQMSRPGLDALLQEAMQDRSVSHILTPRPDRLARPNEVETGVALERRIRQAIGVDLVFRNRVCGRLNRGAMMAMSEWLPAALEYEQAARFRRDLAEKIILSQLYLAKQGCSTGGRAKYGLRRWLIDANGQPVRALADGEIVRQAGHHVVWLPREDGTYEIRLRIKRELAHMRATQLVRILTAEGIPTPDAGRRRRDNGVLHLTSGVWHATSIINIGRDRIDSGEVTHGRRSMGDRLRITPTGPRELENHDFQDGSNKPKVIENPPEQRILGPAHFEARIDRAEQEALNKLLDQRGASQRGKPRSRTPAKNPLGGCRIFDMDCHWGMYRVPYGKGFKYVCGLYQQSHGAACHHNSIDGPTAARFILSVIRQKILSPTGMAKFRRRLEAIAAARMAPTSDIDREVQVLRHQLEDTSAQVETVGKNLALAKTPDQYEQVTKIFDELKAREKQLSADLAARERCTPVPLDAKAEVDTAMALVHSLPTVTKELGDFTAAGKAFEAVNARLFLRFGAALWGNRPIRKMVGGILTLGDDPPPIRPYDGPTARSAVKGGVYTAKKA